MDDDLGYNRAEFVEDPDTGEVLAVERTIDYSRAIISFNRAECQHPNTTPYRVRVANGSVQVRNCCVDCGERVGTALPQKDRAWVASLGWQPEEHATSYKARRDAQRRELLLELARRQYAERGRLTKSYSEYIKSEAWRARRVLVLKRCGGICEGCGVKKATEVHHSTYEHLFSEFLFELLGLCHSCHEQITAERRLELGANAAVVEGAP